MTDTSIRSGGRPPANSTTYTSIAGEDMPPGTPVAHSPDDAGTIIPASANSEGPSGATGITSGPAIEGDSVQVQFGGILKLTTAQWDEITGDSGGLTRGIRYYLAVGGGLTSISPSGSEEFVVPIGIGTSATELFVQLTQSTQNAP